jgi:hypothetical protein
MTDQDKIKTLRKALTAAKDHLEYCGYGDSWERECAEEQGLPEKLEEALELTK